MGGRFARTAGDWLAAWSQWWHRMERAPGYQFGGKEESKRMRKEEYRKRLTSMNRQALPEACGGVAVL